MTISLEKTILTSEDIRRSLLRIAHEILETVGENLILIGIKTRGVPLAHRIAENIRELSGKEISVKSLDISAYRDDASTRRTTEAGQLNQRMAVEGRTVVLVDDVLYTGRSIRAAMDAIMDQGLPNKIQIAVLIDRGHRELPIKADYVGKNLPTSLSEKVKVQLSEIDMFDRVRMQSIHNSESE